MSLAHVENEIAQFLSSETPEVICIRGRWGVCKTYAWNHYLRIARDKDTIKLPRYAYVSLFGLNSLDELKYTIFESTVRTKDIGVQPSLETVRSNATAVAERLGRKSLWFLQQLPFVKTHIGSLGPVWNLTVNSQLLCFDDIERKGKGLAWLQATAARSMGKR